MSASAITLATGTMAPLAAIIVAVPTSNTCTMCGGFLARNAAIAAVKALDAAPGLDKIAARFAHLHQQSKRTGPPEH